MKKPIYKRVWFWVVIVVAVIAIGGAAGGSGSDSGSSSSTDVASQQAVQVDSSQESSSDASAETTIQEQEPVEEEPEVPTEYKSALTKAETYSEMMHMSKQGFMTSLFPSTESSSLKRQRNTRLTISMRITRPMRSRRQRCIKMTWPCLLMRYMISSPLNTASSLRPKRLSTPSIIWSKQLCSCMPGGPDLGHPALFVYVSLWNTKRPNEDEGSAA